tara:strand:- start:318 stop:4382 length:4065 start_codon:yes stop_codon:yes gene_type:complete
MGNSNIFSLEQIYRRQLTGNWTDIFDPFIYVDGINPAASASPAHGYCLGGRLYSSPRSFVQRVDYSNDTVSSTLSNSLIVETARCGGAGNMTHGYTFGGTTPANPDSSAVQRIEYANDTSQAVQKGPLSAGGRYVESVGNNSFGYTAGRYPAYYYSRIDRLDYNNDTATAVVRGYDVVKRRGYGAVGNQNFGYLVGGYETPGTGGDGYRSTISRIDYSNDNVATTPKGPLNGVSGYSAATGNANYGYAQNCTYNARLTSIDRIDYANDTATATAKGPLAANNYKRAATGSSSYGYWMGGYSPSLGDNNLISRIDFANDTPTASPKGYLNTQVSDAASCSGREMGLPSSPVAASIIPATQIENGKVTDKGSDGTFTTQTFPLAPAYGYWGGGSPGNGPGPGLLSLIQRLDYSNDSANAVLRSNMVSPDQSRMALSGIASKTHVYWCGGSIPGTSVSHVDRLDLGNDTATAVKKGNLTATNHYAAAAGNEFYGYIFGGRPGGTASSRVDRIDYANDNVTATSKGPLSAAFQYHAATGNADYGYSAGGWVPGNPTSAIDRLDYANDSSAATPKGNLSFGRYNNSATGNANYGWFGGGNCPSAASPSTLTSAIDRIDYANDTATTSPRGGLNNQRVRTGATGSSSYGYWSGGFYYSKIERVDYANDTGTATNRGNLAAFPSANTGLMDFTTAASGQANGIKARSVITYIPRARFIDSTLESPTVPAGPAFGYFAGGVSPTYSAVTQVSRIDYANDTTAVALKGSLSTDHSRGGGTGNNNYGYCLGGDTPYPSSLVQRTDYANDNSTASVKGPLAAAGSYFNSVGNINYGYTGGRNGNWPSVPNNFSMIDRVDYSNDTVTATITNPTGFSPDSGNNYGAVGNQNFGYFVGGQQPNTGNHSWVRRLDYSNDSATTVLKGPITFRSDGITAATGNADFGYLNANNYGNTGSKIDRIDYANDTATAQTKGSLSWAGNRKAATGNADFGYFSGGGYPERTTVDRIDYANDTPTASPKGPLDFVVRDHQAFSARALGLPQTPIAAIAAPFQPPFPFPVQNYDIPTTGYGYVAGGDARSYVHRIDYANDTATASLRGNLPTIAEDGGGAGNQSYGYTMGGYDGSNWSGASRVYRVDYANDTATASERGPLTSGRKYVDSIGNNNYGYTDGGYPSSTQSRIDRVDYANDTNTATSLGNIFSPGNRGTDTAGNLNYGYWGGGGGYLPRQSTVTRLDYSNDTAPTSPRGPLTHPSSSNVAVGNANYGYWQISYFPSTRTQLDRVDYANDTATALPKGNLVAAGGYRQTATGNPNYGYFAGGYNYPSYLSTIQRINYNNDTVIASPKGRLTNFTYDAQSFSAHENGLSG